MSDPSFHKDEYSKPNPVQTKVRADSFGLSTFLIKRGYVTNIRAAKRLSNLLLLALVIMLCTVILVMNSGSEDTEIDEKYYYDPTLTD